MRRTWTHTRTRTCRPVRVGRVPKLRLPQTLRVQPKAPLPAHRAQALAGNYPSRRPRLQPPACCQHPRRQHMQVGPTSRMKTRARCPRLRARLQQGLCRHRCEGRTGVQMVPGAGKRPRTTCLHHSVDAVDAVNAVDADTHAHTHACTHARTHARARTHTHRHGWRNGAVPCFTRKDRLQCLCAVPYFAMPCSQGEYSDGDLASSADEDAHRNAWHRLEKQSHGRNAASSASVYVVCCRVS